MVLPAPNLDDRSYDDLVGGAMSIVERNCPDWTDRSPSDPGVTLIEVMAWLAETVIYRLNRVPDRNYVKFLELLGIRLKPAQAARAFVVFEVAQGRKPETMRHIRSGTELMAASDGSAGEIPFETLGGLDPTPAKVVGLLSQAGDEVADHRALLAPGGRPEAIFCGRSAVPHLLYLGDRHLARDDAGFERVGESLEVRIELSEDRDAVEVEWECLGLQGWTPIAPSSDDTEGLCRSGALAFQLPAALLQEQELRDHSAQWLRARVVSAGDESPACVRLTRCFCAQRLPTAVIVKRPAQPGDSNDLGETFHLTSMDLPAIIRPFGRRAIAGGEMRIASALFGRPGARIALNVRVSDEVAFEAVSALELVWECRTVGDQWRRLGSTNARVVADTDFGLADPTDAFTRRGHARIELTIPSDPARETVDGIDSYWVRVRIVDGSYGQGGSLAPTLTELSIDCREVARPFDAILSVSAGAWTSLDLSGQARVPVSLFHFGTERDPTFCVGLSERPAENRRCSLLFRIASDGEPGSLVWEYFVDRWVLLPGVHDRTVGLTQTGVVEFVPPEDWTRSTLHEQEAFWLRARWVVGTSNQARRLAAVHPNAVEVVQARTHRGHRLGSGSGQAGQKLALPASVLDGVVLRVRELAAHELATAADRVERLLAARDVDAELREDGLWTRWTEVDSLLLAKPDSRVFVLSPDRGEILFGDGRLGAVPPAGSDNIVIEHAAIGGGSRGNVPAGAISKLLSAHASIVKVYNPEPASGGAEAETLDEAKRRAPQFIRSQDRAVTAEDFETLAREASTEVARARCSSSAECVRVVLVPHAQVSQPTPLPTARLLANVRRYLDERRMLNVQLEVSAASYVPVYLEAEVFVLARFAENLGALEDRLRSALTAFVHPIHGRDGEGWPMGRSLQVSEIYHVLEHLPFVDYVAHARLRLEEHGVTHDAVPVPATGFPVLRTPIQLRLRIGGS